MSTKRKPANGGKYARPDDAEAIRVRDAEWQRILKEENEVAWQKRKRRVVMWACMALSAGMMLAMIHYHLIDQLVGELFLAALTAGFGYQAGK